jgi:AhpC/TSA family
MPRPVSATDLVATAPPCPRRAHDHRAPVARRAARPDALQMRRTKVARRIPPRFRQGAFHVVEGIRLTTETTVATSAIRPSLSKFTPWHHTDEERTTIRRMKLKGLFAVGASLVLGVVGGLFGFSQEGPELEVGDPAPGFSLQGSDGRIYTLADFKGKSAVVLAWFPKAFTSG